MTDTKGNALQERLRGNAPATTHEQPATLSAVLAQMKPQFEKALPQHIAAERFLRLALTAVKTTPALANCTQTSFLAALMVSAQCGLEPNTPLGEAYLIPYKNKNKNITEAQFQIGYKGMLAMAHRTKEYHWISARPVYAKDMFEYSYGLDPKLTHVPADEPEGEPIYYYAAYRSVNGGGDFRVWSRKKILAHAKKFSPSVKAGQKSPWDTNFDQMAMKTVLKDLLSYAPKTIEFARNLAMDETIRHEVADDMSTVPAEFADAVDAEFEYNDGEAPPETEQKDAAEVPGAREFA